MYFWERKNGIQDSDEKSAGCGILMKKERECGIRTPLPDPVECNGPSFPYSPPPPTFWEQAAFSHTGMSMERDGAVRSSYKVFSDLLRKQ